MAENKPYIYKSLMLAKQCPVCTSTRIESFMMATTATYDPNAKLCRDCNYCWRQVNPNA